MTGDLIGFITARLDEDEARAKDDFVCEPIAVKERTLREVTAKRAIIATVFAYEAKIDGEWGCCHSAAGIAAGYCPEIEVDDVPALRELAAIWSDHPDYRDEWTS